MEATQNKTEERANEVSVLNDAADKLMVNMKPDIALELYSLVKQGYTKAEIRIMYGHWKAKKFNGVWNQVQNIMTENVLQQEEAKAEAITRYQDLYRRAMKIGNIKEARNILDSLCKVQGINNDTNIQADFVAVWK